MRKNIRLSIIFAIIIICFSTAFIGIRFFYHGVIVHAPVSFVPLLVRIGPDIDQKDQFGFTALHLCSVTCQIKKVRVLISMGANIEAKTVDGWTPLHVVMGTSPIPSASIEELLDHGADIEARANDGKTPLMLAVWNGVDSKIINYLISRGAKIDSKDNEGNTALAIAIRHNNYNAAQLLVAKGAKILSPNNKGFTPLQEGMMMADKRFLNLLIDNVDVNEKGLNGWTALHIAARENNLDAAKRLVERGADINAQDEKGRTPIDVGKEYLDKYSTVAGYLQSLHDLTK